MWRTRNIGRYALLGAAAIGAGYAIHESQGDINSIGIVRLSRAAATVSFFIYFSQEKKMFLRLFK